jgi:hypothetical protein
LIAIGVSGAMAAREWRTAGVLKAGLMTTQSQLNAAQQQLSRVKVRAQGATSQDAMATEPLLPTVASVLQAVAGARQRYGLTIGPVTTAKRVDVKDGRFSANAMVESSPAAKGISQTTLLLNRAQYAQYAQFEAFISDLETLPIAITNFAAQGQEFSFGIAVLGRTP